MVENWVTGVSQQIGRQRPAISARRRAAGGNDGPRRRAYKSDEDYLW